MPSRPYLTPTLYTFKIMEIQVKKTKLMKYEWRSDQENNWRHNAGWVDYVEQSKYTANTQLYSTDSWQYFSCLEVRGLWANLQTTDNGSESGDADGCIMILPVFHLPWSPALWYSWKVAMQCQIVALSDLQSHSGFPGSLSLSAGWGGGAQMLCSLL